MTGESIITVKKMVKKFGSFTANDNLNFEVYKGEIFGFLGANGQEKQPQSGFFADSPLQLQAR